MTLPLVLLIYTAIMGTLTLVASYMGDSEWRRARKLRRDARARVDIEHMRKRLQLRQTGVIFDDKPRGRR